jgi:hypothetical protein
MTKTLETAIVVLYMSDYFSKFHSDQRLQGVEGSGNESLLYDNLT